MKKRIFILIFILFQILVTSALYSQISLSLISQSKITPNSFDTIGAFSRIYYYYPKNKFYITYSSRQYGSKEPEGRLSKYAWREYDTSLAFTGKSGYLSGFSSAGDYAMILIDTTFYHLSPNILDYKLTKIDGDFNVKSTKTIVLDSNDSNMDQMLNYANNKIFFGAFHEPKYIHPGTVPQLDYTPYMHIFQYDLNLQQLATPILLPQIIISWGSSIYYRNGLYYIVTFDDFTLHKLYVFKYDSNFNFLQKILISNDGQWCQGLIFDDQYYYLAYHQGNHNQGNIVLGVYDTDWKLITSKVITNFNSTSNRFNANRPFLTKVGNKLYVSYDIETYTFMPPSTIINQKDWQAQVDVYQILKTTPKNSPPSKPIIKIPTMNNELMLSYPAKKIKFEWNASKDIDNDAINYTLNISGKDFYYSGETKDSSVNVSIMDMLKINETYRWHVRASDSKDSVTSDTMTFKTSKTITEIRKDQQYNYELSQNYPNPFNPTTTITFSIPENTFVNMKVYDIFGREIETLVSKYFEAGVNQIIWQPQNLPSGVYYYKIKAGEYAKVMKSLLLR